MNNVKKTLDGKLDEVQSKIQQIEASNQSKIQHIEASYKEATLELTKNIEGMGKRLLQRIDDRIDELINRQDKIFEEMTNARNEQDSTVNIFKTDAADLIHKVNEVSEKIVDFEKNKRNNLILFGIPNDHHETPTSLDAKVEFE